MLQQWKLYICSYIAILSKIIFIKKNQIVRVKNILEFSDDNKPGTGNMILWSF